MRKAFLTLGIFLMVCCYSNAETLPLAEKKSGKVYLKTRSNGSIVLRSTSPAPVSFFLFDLDGKLIRQATLKEDTKETIGGLKKGSYLYNMLSEDEVVGQGNLIIK